MKRFIAYLSVAAALTACNLYGEPESSTAPLEADGIEIAVSAVKDDSFTVTLTPKGEAAYYSYLVDDSDKVEELDPSAVYKVSYKSIMQGTVCYAKSKTYTFTVQARPNTPYVVYAVSSSKEGNVGELAFAQVSTSDVVAPEIAKFDSNGRTVQFEFSENVKYVGGKAITAKYYASNRLAKTYLPYVDDSQKMGVTAAADTKVSVNGNVATVEFPTIPDGAYYAIVMEDGAFVDSANLPCEGFETVYTYNAETEEISVNLPYYGKIDAAAMTLQGEQPEVLLDYNAYISFNTRDYISGAVVNMVKVKRSYTADGKTITEESVLPGAPYYGALSANKFGVKLAEEPGRGDYVTITVPEKTVYDVYGNYNSELVIGPVLYSYGYTLDDVCGSYTFSCVSGYGFGPYENVIEIKASDKADEGNVMLVGELTDVQIKVYANFNTDTGELELPSVPVVGTAVEVEIDDDGNPLTDEDGNYITTTYYAALCMSTTGQNIITSPLGFDMAAAHELSFWYQGQAFVGILCLDEEGNAIMYHDLIQFSSITYTPAATASVKGAPAAARFHGPAFAPVRAL